MNEFQEGYEFARRYSTRKKVEVVSEPLPFRVSTKEEIYAKLESLKTQMRVEPVGMEEGALLLLETNLPWRISPETNLARLHAEQYQLGKYEQKRKDNNPEAWRELAPIHHEAARVTAEKKWSSIQDTITKLVTSNSTEEYNNASPTEKRLFRKAIDEKANEIKEIQRKIQENNTKLPATTAYRQALDKVLGESYKKSLTKKIKSVKAYHHGKRLKDRARLGEELVKLNQKINEELPKSTLKIGFQDGKFFEMLVIKSIKIDPETKQETTIIQGMLVQEPNRSTKERQLKPSGILILPWTVDRHTTPDGKIFVNIALRNEPGADNLVTLTTGEQTSASKLMGIDPRKEPGRAHLAVCVQETLAVKCENVPELRDIIPDKFIATRGIRDGNRMSGGHNGYGIIEIDHGSPLLPLYEANNWIELDTLQEMILESAKGEALVSEYLLANLSLLYAHLRTEDKVRINNLETMLGDISTNPFTLKNLGWMIGVMHNYLEKLTKTK